MLESGHTNHAASDDPTMYPSHTRMTVDQLQTIAQMTTGGATPRVILAALCENDHTWVSVSKDVYDAFNVDSDLVRCLIFRFGMKQSIGACQSRHCWISSKTLRSSIIFSAQQKVHYPGDNFYR